MDLDQSIKLEDNQYTNFTDYSQIPKIIPLIDAELSEPYSIYTYRYFLYGWHDLSIFAYYNNEIGVITFIEFLGCNRKTRQAQQIMQKSGLHSYDRSSKEIQASKNRRILAQKFMYRIKKKVAMKLYQKRNRQITLD